MSDSPIGIAGSGRIAQAMGRLLRERGEPVAALGVRDPGRAAPAAAFVGVPAVLLAELPRRAGRILIAVPDRAVEPVAAELAAAGMNRGAALHTCGARGPDALAPLAGRGVSCATLHPLQTIATPEQGVAALSGCAFAIAGEGPAAEWAADIAALLGGRALRLDADHCARYHAAAVMASNYVVGLLDAAVMLMESAGVDEAAARAALGPLVLASARNALELGPLPALTGPIERGDVDTVARHWRALSAAPATVRDLYRSAALHVLAMARRRGLAEEPARGLEGILRNG